MLRRFLITTALACLAALCAAGPALAKDRQATLRELKRQVQEKPNDPEAYFNLGWQLEQTGRLKEAQAAYRKVISLKPDDPRGYLGLGSIQATLGDYETGIKTLKKALSLKEDFPAARTRLAQVYNDYGVVLAQQQLYGRAAEALQQAIRLDPQAKAAQAARNNLGIIYYSEGRLSEAMEQFQEVLRQNPDNPQATYNLGVSYYMSGDAHLAWAQFLRLRTLDPAASGELSALIYTPERKANYAPQPDIDPDTLKLTGRYQMLLNPPGESTSGGWEVPSGPPGSTGPPRSAWETTGGSPKSSWNPGQQPKSSW